MASEPEHPLTAGKRRRRRVEVVLLGASGAGKTALLRRWLTDRFEEDKEVIDGKHEPSLGPDVVCCDFVVEKPKELVTLQVWVELSTISGLLLIVLGCTRT